MGRATFKQLIKSPVHKRDLAYFSREHQAAPLLVSKSLSAHHLILLPSSILASWVLQLHLCNSITPLQTTHNTDVLKKPIPTQIKLNKQQ